MGGIAARRKRLARALLTGVAALSMLSVASAAEPSAEDSTPAPSAAVRLECFTLERPLEGGRYEPLGVLRHTRRERGGRQVIEVELEFAEGLHVLVVESVDERRLDLNWREFGGGTRRTWMVEGRIDAVGATELACSLWGTSLDVHATRRFDGPIGLPWTVLEELRAGRVPAGATVGPDGTLRLRMADAASHDFPLVELLPLRASTSAAQGTGTNEVEPASRVSSSESSATDSPRDQLAVRRVLAHERFAVRFEVALAEWASARSDESSDAWSEFGPGGDLQAAGAPEGEALAPASRADALEAVDAAPDSADVRAASLDRDRSTPDAAPRALEWLREDGRSMGRYWWDGRGLLAVEWQLGGLAAFRTTEKRGDELRARWRRDRIVLSTDED